MAEPAGAAPQEGALTREKMQSYWSKTSKLMWTIMILWLIFSFGIHLFAPSLNKIKIIGFPLGFYFAAQGSLIVFVILIFWFASKQNRIDEEFGVHED